MNALTRPAAWIALAVLVVNDHVLKGAGILPGWLTGKASDFAGLFLAPLVLGAALGGLRVSRRRAAVAAAGAVAVGFALVKLVAPVNQAVGRVWGPMVLDPTDLVAVPMCGLAAWFMTRVSLSPSRPPGRVVRLASLGAALLACAATQPAPRECYPSWRLKRGAPPAEIGCAVVDGWIEKSGKEGFGLMLALRKTTPEGTCAVKIEDAVFQAGEVRARASRLPGRLELGHEQRDIYLPFPFDNQSLWRASREHAELRGGVISVTLSAGADRGRWDTPARQEVPLPHRGEKGYWGWCFDQPVRLVPPSDTPKGRDGGQDGKPTDAGAAP